MLKNKRKRRLLVEKVRELLNDYLVVKGKVVEKGDYQRKIIKMM